MYLKIQVRNRFKAGFMEQLTNLASLPVSGFKVAAFPPKIKGVSAGPARVVAMID